MTDIERRLDPFGETLDLLGRELAISLSDARVWVALIAAVGLLAACALIGTWACRRVGFLSADAPRGEVLGVGLSSGLLLVAAWWAAVTSEGRSSFTPVAVAFVIALVLGNRVQRRPRVASRLSVDSILPYALSAVAVIMIGLLYGITLAPSPREQAQPIEFFDTAYYSVLGADLARTGTESIYSPSGFEQLPGLPSQTWYHWGEMWLSAATISVLDMDPILARHYVVLPVMLVAAASLTGTLVRRLTGSPSRGAYLFGAVACVVLAPMTLPFPGPYFTKWASGLVFGITQYGLGAVVGLLSIYVISVRGAPGRSWSLALFSGSVIASMLPAQVVLAVLLLVGAATVGGLVLGRALILERRMPSVPAGVWKGVATTSLIGVVTIVWGIITGHQVGASGLSEGISPFNGAWVQAVVRTTVGAGALLAIPIAWLLIRRSLPLLAWISVGTTVMLIVGAVAWGARLSDFNMFHVFFGGIGVFGTPVAAASVVALWRTARAGGHRVGAAAIFVLCGVQLGLGGITGVIRLQGFGSPDHQPIPLSVIREIVGLPADAKLAYACRPLEEPAFWDPSLGSITAHTGRPVVPMCFQAEYFTGLITGTDSSADVANPLFEFAPQRVLYPDSQARPSQTQITAFLLHHGIEYIYADSDHPNVLVPYATLIASEADVQVYRVP